jgi:3-phenylpropionate/trans-cinnamate dioxygenase ferredoxin reductase subunit
MSSQTVLIIGASHAGAQCAISLRQSGFDGDITLIGDETEIPYHRPPLSKGFLSGSQATEELSLRPASVYENANITLKLGTRVVKINRAKKTITTDKNETLPYSRLILATGARVRKLPILGAEKARVFYLRDAVDVRKIKDTLPETKRAVIIGGGYIGLETAASLRKLGIQVTVLEAMHRILQRVTAPIMSDFYRRIHTEEEVNIVEGESANRITEASEQLIVNTKSGAHYEADIVIIGIGVIPNTELAKDAGLEVENGIVINEFCQTLDKNIYAIGDVTWHHNPIYDVHLRLESVPNATEQAKTAALHINGAEKPYKSLPYFWSDQFDLKLQIAGLSEGYDDIIIRGDKDKGRSFSAFYFKGTTFIAVDAVNDPRAFMFAKTVLNKGQNLDKTALANLETELRSTVLT